MKKTFISKREQYKLTSIRNGHLQQIRKIVDILGGTGQFFETIHCSQGIHIFGTL